MDAADFDRRRSRRIGRVLLGCIVFVLAAWGAYALLQEVGSATLVGGPMVQNVSSEAATVIWYMSRPSIGGIEVRDERGASVFAAPSANEETRHRARVSGLHPDRAYGYAVFADGRRVGGGTIHTSPVEARAYKFAVLGDTGRASPQQFSIGARMAEMKPDFVLHTGDVVYPGGERLDYPDKFFAPYAALLTSVCLWPVLGNHDAGEPTLGGDYLGVFELPENGPAGATAEANYWFDYGETRIVAIDTNVEEGELSGRVAGWLRTALKDERPRWRFVLMHHPPYTVGKHRPDERVQRVLVPIFEECRVDLVFAGHDHLYERTHPMSGGTRAESGTGVVYVVSGAGGAQLYKARPVVERPEHFAVVYDQTHGFTWIEVNGDELRLRHLSVSGETIDDWSMSKR